MQPRIAVIGAGIAGIALGAALAGRAQVTVFEKSRGLGGRMATRRSGDFAFDHGTQFLTARDPRFAAAIAPLLGDGRLAEWKGKLVYLDAGRRPRKRLWFEPHFVPVPSMSTLCRALAGGLTLLTGVEIDPLDGPTAAGWRLRSAGAPLPGTFDWVLCTAPAPQAARLLDAFIGADDPLRAVRYHACHALMLGLDGPWDPGWIAGKSREAPVEWIAVQGSRPGRDAGAPALVAQASAAWSDAHVELEAAEAEALLAAEVHALTGLAPERVALSTLHRWRYALLDAATAAPGPFLDPVLRLGACGDWSAGASRVEDAWLAGHGLGERLAGML